MKKLVVITIIGLSAVTATAQPSKGNPGGNPTPFGFTEILLAAGAALGGKKAYDKYKEQDTEE